MSKRLFKTMVALLAIAAAATGPARAQSTSQVTDVMNREWTGRSGPSYGDWSGLALTSDAVYAGQTAGGNNAIQMRSNNQNSGIVTTTSGGTVASVTVTWNSNTPSGRTLEVYGKHSAYSSASDLYGDNAGDLLGSIVYGTSTPLTIEGDYEYIGLRSMSGAMYLDEIQVVWNVAGSATPEQIAALKKAGVKLYFLACGTSDFLWEQSVTLDKTMTDCGLEHTFYKSDGGHVWSNWRLYLNTFAQLLFK